nr:PREDICTED: vacuolar protein 8-like [Latimeria chalumnae]|eukprot:XP_006007785.1 PREDICTED: vacuolar protein 8-like [Latimeria chalumnae]
MGQFCNSCMQLLKDLVDFVKRISASAVQKIRDCVAAICQCTCLKRSKAQTSKLYEPVLQQHEKRAAQEFLEHIETAVDRPVFAKESLEALNTLAFSENPSLQQSAALYYLHISQQLNTPLPAEHLEPYRALLQSSDLEVQQIASLSLANLLVEENINKELVVRLDLHEPLLELLGSGDSTVQCNSCACLAALATSESNREAIVAERGVVPMLILAKSYDPRVQQNAVGAILNLTHSERIQLVLCEEGALPVLTLLLQSADSEVQYYSCAALSNIAANPQHHRALLQIGDGLLLRTLLSLTSSSVEKVSYQACVCLRNLAENADIQVDIVSLSGLPQLCTLLRSPSEALVEVSAALLSTLSQNPANGDAIACEGLLKTMGILLLTRRAKSPAVDHIANTIKNVIVTKNLQAIIDSQCTEGLLLALVSTELHEESLLHVAGCVAELTKHELILSHMLSKVDSRVVGRLVELANQVENTELSFHAAFVINQLGAHERIVQLLKSHTKSALEYLLQSLRHQEIRFQQLGLSTVCILNKDPDFSLAFNQSPLMKQLHLVNQQTEETRVLLKAAINQPARSGQREL